MLLAALDGPCLSAPPPPASGWIELTGAAGLAHWRTSPGAWREAGDARLDSSDAARLAPVAGSGVILNGPAGRTRDLVSNEEFEDVEVHLEFLIPRGSNSGIKLQALYEVQISDSAGRAHPSADDCGGVYPRAELLPRYHHIDDGHPPRVNAARPAGEWQSLDLVFRAPRFNREGQKTANARLERVVLNGQTVHEGLELRTPTGHAWRLPEVRRGPILLQGDHGPVAFRNVRARRLE